MIHGKRNLYTFKFHETINVDLMRFFPFLFSLFFLFYNKMVSKMVSFIVILASHIKNHTPKLIGGVVLLVV